MELYNRTLDECLGRLYEGDNGVSRIKCDFAAGEKVMLRSFYGEHWSGNYDYTITVERLDEGEDSWEIPYIGLNQYLQKRVDFGDNNEAIVLCRFATNGTYSFYTDDDSLTYTLYLNNDEIESGTYITFDYNAREVNSLKVKVTPNNQVLSSYIKVRFDGYLHQEYSLSIGNPVTVTVSDGAEAWLTFIVPETGTYKFYSTISTTNYCDNYGQLWIDGVLVAWDDDGGNNSQFYIDDQKLTGGQTVTLRTYSYGHDLETISYTVHAEKVE